MTDDDASGSYRDQVYEAFADRQRSLQAAIETALDASTKRLGVGIGFVTRIEDGRQYIEHAVGGHEAIQPGAECPLEEAYCRRTLELDGQLSVQDARASAEISDSAYEAFGLGTYIGSKLTVDGNVYGTVCFADGDTRDTPFSESDALFVELVARLVEGGIERRKYEEEREQRAAQLEAEKRRFKGIAETSFDIIFRVDSTGQFTYVSEAVERVLGYPPDQLLGEQFVSYLTEQSVLDATEAFEQSLDGQTVTGLELTFRDTTGESTIIEINATPVERGDAAIQGVGRDVTERKEREAELRVKTRAMDEAAIPITIADATAEDHPTVYANKAFEEVTGYSPDAIEDRNCRILQGAGTDPDAVAELRAGIESNRPVTSELLNYRRDGTPFWNQVTVTPIRDEDGRVTHYLGFQQDVTERKRTAQLVELLNRVLRHNLRNELTVIEGHADFIGDPPPGVDVEAGIRRPLRRLLSLSDSARELETYAKRERDVQRLDPQEMLDRVVADHREEFPDATVCATVETDREIAAGRELERAIDELVTNALVHDPDERTTVDLTVSDDGDWIEITVADDGPGVSAMEATVVQSGRETALEHGKGLGLWLVNWIVTRYGGSFQIDGADGTVATIRLPAIGHEQSVADAARRPTTLFC